MDSASDYRKKEILHFQSFLRDKLDHYESTSASFKRWHSRLQSLSTALAFFSTFTASSGLVVSAQDSSNSVDPPLFGVTAVLAAATSAVNVYLKILSKKSNKHEMIRKLAFSTLDSIDSLVQLSLEDGVISSDEYRSIKEKFNKFEVVSSELRFSDHTDSADSKPSPV